MSTSPSYSFFVAFARACFPPPETTSCSTFFSREMASTNINSSRFMRRLSYFLSKRRHPQQRLPCPNDDDPALLRLGRAPFEIDDGRQPRFTQLVEREAQRLQWRRFTLFTHSYPRLDGRGIAPHDLPPTAFGALQRAAEFLAIGIDAAGRRLANGFLERQVHLLAFKTDEVLLVAQQTVDAGRRNFQALVIGAIDFQRKLQLACHPFTVFDGD